MTRTMVSMLLVGFFMMQPAFAARAAGAKAASDNAQVAAFRRRLQGAEPGAQVEVKLLDKNVFRGRLVSVGDEDFILRSGDGMETVSHRVRFEDIKNLKVEGSSPAATAVRRPRKGISRRGKIMLVVGIAALVFGVVTYATTKGP
jgi:hypothetical protein